MRDDSVLALICLKLLGLHGRHLVKTAWSMWLLSQVACMNWASASLVILNSRGYWKLLLQYFSTEGSFS